MLPRHLRLRRPADFLTVRQRGKRWHNALAAVNAMPNQLPHNRYGVVVGKRLGTAVRRNRVRRRLRAALYHLLPRMAAGYDVVIVAQPAAAQATFADLAQALSDLLRDAGLLDA